MTRKKKTVIFCAFGGAVLLAVTAVILLRLPLTMLGQAMGVQRVQASDGETYRTQNREDLELIADYLLGIEGESVGISPNSEGGYSLTVSPTEERPIEDAAVSQALDRLYARRQGTDRGIAVLNISKNGNTVEFSLWSAYEIGAAIGYGREGGQTHNVEVPAALAELEGEGWFF